MSKRSFNYKRNRKKPRDSSAGGTPGPLGRIHQKRDFSDIAKEINKLKRINQLRKTVNKETNEPVEVIASKFSSKLFQSNLNEQSQSSIHSAASFVQQRQQQDRKTVLEDEVVDLMKSERLSLNNEKLAVNLSVKQRAQMFEEVVVSANKSTAPAHLPRAVSLRKPEDACASESLANEKRCQKRTKIPKYQKTFATMSPQ
ncbi:unnamed protein product [Litomosoides sigmodontis]|uniref:Uncharacterized protein n=1 Tax=Litomosoides sigmodontis TaxID=42156 RepID=A0A3P7JM72_LITSI|nr:unnamed protein product [Litomosoides sigmodontis]